MKTYAFTLLCILPIFCFAMEPDSLTQATNLVFVNVLGAYHDSAMLMRHQIDSQGWTEADCSEILALSERALSQSTKEFDIQRRENAIFLMGEFCGTNALTELSRLVVSENHSTWNLAVLSLMKASKANPVFMNSITQAIASPSPNTTPKSTMALLLIQDILSEAGPEPVYQQNLLRFLLGRISVETGEFSKLDEILCREIPKWRASPQRAANAEKMIREHPEDVRLVAFFENVRSNALESARAATSEGSSTNDVPGKGSCEKAPTKSTFDPWADLLEDLPEKEPWTPPPGTERPY